MPPKVRIQTIREFIELAENDDDRAKTCSADKTLWMQIVQHHPELKEIAIHNKNSPILEEMASDPDPKIRSIVARQRRCSSELLECLARDPDDRVRLAVAENGKTPEESLERLRMDDNPLVLQAARSPRGEIHRMSLEFLSSQLRDSWIEDGTMRVHLRKSRRWIGGEKKRFIDIASVEVEEPGRGIFRRFLSFLHRHHDADGIFLECIVNPRFAKFCSKIARIVPMCEEISPSFYLMKNDKLAI